MTWIFIFRNIFSYFLGYILSICTTNFCIILAGDSWNELLKYITFGTNKYEVVQLFIFTFFCSIFSIIFSKKGKPIFQKIKGFLIRFLILILTLIVALKAFKKQNPFVILSLSTLLLNIFVRSNEKMRDNNDNISDGVLGKVRNFFDKWLS